MEHASFIVGSYVITFASIGVYVWWFLRRGKKLAQNVNSEDMPWT
jgi:heme exporter protein CcmD